MRKKFNATNENTRPTFSFGFCIDHHFNLECFYVELLNWNSATLFSWFWWDVREFEGIKLMNEFGRTRLLRNAWYAFKMGVYQNIHWHWMSLELKGFFYYNIFVILHKWNCRVRQQMDDLFHDGRKSINIDIHLFENVMLFYSNVVEGLASKIHWLMGHITLVMGVSRTLGHVVCIVGIRLFRWIFANLENKRSLSKSAFFQFKWSEAKENWHSCTSGWHGLTIVHFWNSVTVSLGKGSIIAAMSQLVCTWIIYIITYQSIYLIDEFVSC